MSQNIYANCELNKNGFWSKLLSARMEGERNKNKHIFLLLSLLQANQHHNDSGSAECIAYSTNYNFQRLSFGL